MTDTHDTLACALKIEALVQRTRAFDEEHAAIVVMQHLTEEVRPSVVSVMLDYGQRMRAFEADLRALSPLEFAALTQSRGV